MSLEHDKDKNYVFEANALVDILGYISVNRAADLGPDFWLGVDTWFWS